MKKYQKNIQIMNLFLKFCIDLGSLGSHPGGPGADSGAEKPPKMKFSKM